MSLLDGLKDSLKNPLAENNDEMEFILESDFETALEKAIDVKLSPADIAAILNGDDDIDDEEDDLDDLDAKLKEFSHLICNYMNMTDKEIYSKFKKLYDPLTRFISVDLSAKASCRTPETIKKDIKHEKNPMRLKQLNQELNKSYKIYRTRRK